MQRSDGVFRRLVVVMLAVLAFVFTVGSPLHAQTMPDPVVTAQTAPTFDLNVTTLDLSSDIAEATASTTFLDTPSHLPAPSDRTVLNSDHDARPADTDLRTSMSDLSTTALRTSAARPHLLC